MWNSQVRVIPKFSFIAKKDVSVQIRLHLPQGGRKMVPNKEITNSTTLTCKYPLRNLLIRISFSVFATI